MQIAVCTDIDVGKVLGEFNNPRLGTKDRNFVQGKGFHRFMAGDVITTASEWPGMQLSKNIDPDLTRGGSLSIYLQPHVADDAFTATFAFGRGGLSSSSWLHPDGRSTKLPCAGVVDNSLKQH